jgi:hypothetical protein
MLGLPKLLVLILIFGVGWYLYKAIQRRGVSGIFRDGDMGPARPTGQPKALDMEKCRICGDFVPPGAQSCAQDRCPYPAR